MFNPPISFQRSPKKSFFLAGFTLVEILVVLLLLGIVGSLLTVNLSPDERGDLVRQARDLTGSLEYATDRARWQHELLGLAALPDGKGWQFLLINTTDAKSAAATIDDDPQLKPRLLPEGMTFRPLHYAAADAAEDTILPILPSGRFEPFDVALVWGTWRVVLSVDPLGRISTSSPETTTDTP
jgi:type II secretion system protein H